MSNLEEQRKAVKVFLQAGENLIRKFCSPEQADELINEYRKEKPTKKREREDKDVKKSKKKEQEEEEEPSFKCPGHVWKDKVTPCEGKPPQSLVEKKILVKKEGDSKGKLYGICEACKKVRDSENRKKRPKKQKKEEPKKKKEESEEEEGEALEEKSESSPSE